MNLNVPTIPDSACKLIPVASELIPGKLSSITCEGQKFEVVDRFTFPKDEFIPKGFLKIVLGKEVDINKIWQKYSKSEALIVYVCFPLIEKEADPGEAKTDPGEEKVASMFS